MSMTVDELKAKLEGAPGSAIVVVYYGYRRHNVAPEFTSMCLDGTEFEIDVDETEQE